MHLQHMFLKEHDVSPGMINKIKKLVKFNINLALVAVKLHDPMNMNFVNEKQRKAK